MTTIYDAIREARSIGLTRSQLRYLRAVRAETVDGLPATHRGLAARLRVTPGAVYAMLTRLQRDGLVSFRHGQARTIRLTEAGAAATVLEAVECGTRGEILSSVPCEAT